MPRPLSSPTIRLYPQRGSRQRDEGSDRAASARVAALPASAASNVQRRATSWRCQRSSVSGLIGKAGQAGRASERLSEAKKRAISPRQLRAARPAGGGSPARAAGRGSPAPSSDAAVPAIRARTDSGQPDTDDQSKQSSLDHGKSAEPSEPDAPESRGRVCEPYALGRGGTPLVALAGSTCHSCLAQPCGLANLSV